ncbi:RNA methyltransferase [Kovacikia minuta CCNUW1]|uniref:RNA methyltransferase n=1 Tax=Kovacikia minuta TaxID=2931930 RepID=UPI001CCBE34D|nr:RNA methyltransferase [Kovacikia minuta]UBF28880.1 RNA methyltransferase [Kovacikia minuta CCNUW1]
MVKTALANIRIVLVEPAGALNVGAIARAMKNMGLRTLILVAPKCDLLGPEARQMAVHAGDVLEAAGVVGTLPEALRGCRWAIATTARPRTLDITLEPPKIILPWLLEVAHHGNAALIFGPEDRGLNNRELSYAQRFLQIPTSPIYPSLNLAQAVAICCYELFQASEVRSQESAVEEDTETQGEGNTGTSSTQSSVLSPQSSASIQHSTLKTSTPHTPHPTPASLDSLEAYYQHLEAVLLKIGYLYPHTADSRMRKFRRLFNRALPSTEEVALLRGILSQIEWAIQNPRSGKEGIEESEEGK